MIHLGALGPAEVLVDGEPPPRELLWRKNLALLFYLAGSPERRRSREHLVGLLWGDKPDQAARHSLNEALRVIRRSGGEDVIISAGDQLTLSDHAVTIDTDLLLGRLEAEDWEGAADLVRGPFLEGFGVPDSSPFEDWLAAERIGWADRAGEALRRHAEARLARGDTEGAARAAGRALTLDPFSDAAVRLTMLAAALRGERAAALGAYEVYARRLSAELDLTPEPETQELAERVRSERSWKLPETVPEEERWARRLPMVGRERELEAALAVCQKGHRERTAALVVIQGESGAGKTRLGEELAARARLEGVAAAHVRVVPSDAARPWSALAGLVTSGLLEGPGTIRVSPPALAALLPHVAEPNDRLAAIAVGAEPAPFSRAFAELARVAASRQPVFLWIDGAEHMDPESAAALEGILRDVENEPCVLLLTACPYPASPAVDALRSRIGRDVAGVALVLQPLGRAAIEELAQLIVPELAGEDLARLARRIEVDSAGLPLFASELLNAVRLGLEVEELGGWPEPFRTMDQTYPGDLPDSVVAAIRIGFRRLSKDAQQLLAAASVLEERPDASALGRATGLEGPALQEALDELEWNRWLVAEQRGYVFVARIVRDVVARDMLTAGQRRRILDAAGS